MPQILFATDTTPNLGDLDANFAELFGVLAPFVRSPSTDGAQVLSTLAVPLGCYRDADVSGISTAGVSFSLGARVGATPRTFGRFSVDMEFDTTSHLRFAVVSGGTLVSRLKLRSDGALLPEADGTQTLGAGASRWSVVYASTGTINTSDAREKTAVRALTSAEIAASKALAVEIGAFKFLAAIAAKGEPNARTHIGMTVQRAIEVMEAHGLDPFAYGFICFDSWPGRAATETEPARAAGDRYSFRPDELLLFLARGFEARLAALEAAAA